MLNVVKEAIDYYDPCGLLNIGALEGEYLMEAKLIRDAIMTNGLIKLKETIIKIFNDTLGETIEETVAINVTNRIMNGLSIK